MKLALLRTKIMEDVLNHVKKYDDPDRRKDMNYVGKITEETGWSHTSVVKCLKILDQLDIVEKERNGRKKTIKLNVDFKS